MARRTTPDFSRCVYDVAGLPFDATDLAGATRIVLQAVRRREPLFVSTPNLNFLIACQSDAVFRQSINESDLCLADGMPVVWIARLLGIPIRSRVAGSDLFEALCAQSEHTVRVYFFGGPDGAARDAAARVNGLADQARARGVTPGVVCVGHESPGFGSIDAMSSPELISRINASHADFVVVALGARKGQEWIQRNRAALDAPVISHLGAVVNMAAGTIARAPRWMQRVGLEWIWRIKEEPMLWRRYASDGLALLRLLTMSVLPRALARPLRSIAASLTRSTAGIARTESNEGVLLRISGHWREADLPRLREALAELGAYSGSVKIVATPEAVRHPAVAGLMALLPTGWRAAA